ncbi:D-alanyl-D-alanine carboxypeptidase family protein [Bordetella holmesii 30539]|uniref:serine-type D-Ala-D-Ala carboxypeptidase n=2 Tax=Bordetella holmesii TaxID=35814 RepID=A0ABN0S2G5_9BORD|nr:D-alanyl-D-alanine carboxypeptidase family protein [Bordetella holmesii ATCC 51541]AIT25954.1 D-alanyl-D-alanine carboxypeptidase family protein [Bordetella holmesii 44057]EWM44204.1 D-alanyl-D-alanine carboxypeptidase family protein [Bordetella holmesii 41130]EWM46525.1 D-alanyl-D-alanine carboxypeptidase family protein [Bordetella holmesii 35009]EWM50690.1 D-alanyl-D-alanine carboxypeptidase family protein [Bordetella holmesii 70147]EXF89563.1 D-alanyl-D-alanine carboxypeptidase family pr
MLAGSMPVMAQQQTPAAVSPAASMSAPATAAVADSVVAVGDLASVPAPTVAARAWITVDVNSGQVLAASNPDQKVEPASLTKIMTAYVVFNALDEKRLTLERQVPVSEHAWRTGGSRMFIEPRKPVTADELIQGMIVQSGNDASVALAEAVGGSETAFAALMNEQAERLGMKGTHFMNATGLPDPQHITTVRDLATLATHLVADHPEYFHYYKQKSYTYNKITQPNRNRLLWADPSVDGMKTGHTDSAGFCLVSTALRGDRRVLTVLVGADSESTRAEESLKLLNWSFQNFDTVKLYDKSQPGLDARVWEGKAENVKLGPPNPIWLAVPRGKGSEIKPVAQRTDPLVAPLVKGQQVGMLQLTLDGKVLRSEPLVVQEDVERAGFFGRMTDTVKRWFQ